MATPTSNLGQSHRHNYHTSTNSTITTNEHPPSYDQIQLLLLLYFFTSTINPQIYLLFHCYHCLYQANQRSSSILWNPTPTFFNDCRFSLAALNSHCPLQTIMRLYKREESCFITRSQGQKIHSMRTFYASSCKVYLTSICYVAKYQQKKLA